ncbi:MAG: nitrile hydratase subunit alpha [Deltaproteobacteria bacterium]|nr:MAG: nitrile hydratase subunit alpha [Deltaproteobacteria bacterium]
MTERDANALRAEALESLLVEKGLVRSEVVDAIIRRFEQDIGPMNGAKAVARAWSDPGYRARLLADPWAAIAELGVTAIPDAPLVVVENGPAVHNVVVCTLCSCYPSGLLGLPPSWYKSPAYRARMVREPRAVLAEMGLVLPADVEVRVWDSSAEMRYMVLPERPAGTDAMSQDDLAALVTRDAMIGVARAGRPPEVGGDS